MSTINIEKVKQRLAIRHRDYRARLTSRREFMLNRIQSCIPELIKEFPDISRVILFGSLISDDKFNELSDIDLAVEGLAKVDYFKLHLWLEKRLNYEDIDIIRLEEIKPTYRATIDKGLVLFEK